MPDIFGYIKKKKEKEQNKIKWHKMELYGLDCVDLVVSYTIQFIFIAKKCKFSKNHWYSPPLQLPTDMDWQTATLRRNLCEERKGLKKEATHTGRKRWLHSELKRSMALHFLAASRSVSAATEQLIFRMHLLRYRAGCSQMCYQEESFNTQRWSDGFLWLCAFTIEKWDIFRHFECISENNPVKDYHKNHNYKSTYYK